MLKYTVKITGTQQEIDKMRLLGSKLLDMSMVLRGLGTQLKTYYSKTVFSSQGGAIGKEWQQLSPAYKKWKARHYPNKGILVASGTMQRSFRATSTRNTLTIDNTDPKFIWHQLGTGFGGASLLSVARGKSMFRLGGIGPGRGNNLPARPMLAVNTDVTEMIAVAIEADVRAKIAGAA